MVLQKVGEFLTTINVNGTERVSQLQDSDKTYNISEIFNTDIIINGNNEGSFNQAEDSTYDINVSDRRNFNTNRFFSTTNNREVIIEDTFDQSGWVKFRLTSGNDAGVDLDINGNYFFRVYDSNKTEMKYVNAGDSYKLDGFGGGSSGETWNAYFSIVTNETVIDDPAGNSVRIPTGVDVNSVNKQ